MHSRIALSLAAALCIAAAPLASPALAHDEEGKRLEGGAAYAQLPLAFEPNRGQTDSQVDFLARGRGYSLFLTPSEAVLSVRGSSHPVRMQLVGAAAQPTVSGQQELPGRVNYLTGNDPSVWRSDVPTFGRVQYQGVYPGVDLEYYGHHGQLEYDFVVAPGADPSAIGLEFQGAESIDVDARGDLVVRLQGGGEVRQPRPYVYQDIAGQRSVIGGDFTLDSTGKVGFELAAYDARQPLVIDPVLEYSTFLGGSGEENHWGGVTSAGIAVDAKGAAYVVGSTTSAHFPGVRRNVVDPTFNDGEMDVFVAKINPAGTALEYATYLGGVGFDMGFGIALDGSGNAYVTGLTTSANDFPLVNAFQAAFGGGAEDAFVAKLNATGSGLEYSTFLGGNGPGWGEAAYGIAVFDNTAHVVGVSNSTNFPKVNAAQPALGGMTDIFVTRLNTAGSGLLYSTFLGGSDEDIGYGIGIDRAGNAYVTGNTRSDGLASAPNVIQPTRNGPSDAIVAKYSQTGTRVYATYLGGGGDEIGYGIAADTPGSAYVAGRTGGTFYITPGWFDPACLDPAGFVAKLSPDATALVYAGCIDAPGKDGAMDLAIDRAGNAYITGFTLSPAFQTVDGFQNSLKGTQDAFVAKINAAGSVLVYSSLLGGSGVESGLAIAVDYAGHAYVTGITGSPADFPTKNPLQPAYGGGAYDAFVVKIDCGP